MRITKKDIYRELAIYNSRVSRDIDRLEIYSSCPDGRNRHYTLYTKTHNIINNYMVSCRELYFILLALNNNVSIRIGDNDA